MYQKIRGLQIPSEVNHSPGICRPRGQFRFSLKVKIHPLSENLGRVLG